MNEIESNLEITHIDDSEIGDVDRRYYSKKRTK